MVFPAFLPSELTVLQHYAYFHVRSIWRIKAKIHREGLHFNLVNRQWIPVSIASRDDLPPSIKWEHKTANPEPNWHHMPVSVQLNVTRAEMRPGHGEFFASRYNVCFAVAFR